MRTAPQRRNQRGLPLADGCSRAVCLRRGGGYIRTEPTGPRGTHSTQVGSMRAAQDIARSRRTIPERLPPIGDITLPAGEARKMTEELQKEMTRCAAFMRDAEGIRAMRKRLDELIRHRVPLDKNDDELGCAHPLAGYDDGADVHSGRHAV